ncbi:DUF4118 domain-containing protein [bacterium]|nr:DUF4118 domain-containing protein [bacterium]
MAARNGIAKNQNLSAANNTAYRQKHSNSQSKKINLSQYAVATVIILVLVAACYPLRLIIGYQTVALIFLFAVTLLPLKTRMGPALVAAGLSALAWNFFFIPPAFTFVIDEPHNVLMFVGYFVVATVTGILTARVREREKTVRLREERTTALYTLTKDLSAATSLEGVVRAGVIHLKTFLNAEVVVCLSESDGDMLAKPHPLSSMTIDDKEYSIAAWAYWNEKKAGRFTETFPHAQAAYYPLSGPRYPLGVIGVKLLHDSSMISDQESLIENFINQIASAIEREQLNELARKTSVLEESERLYNNIFDSLSHEFKTPIATILISSEQLIKKTPLKNNKDETIATEIHDAAIRLHRLVGNLLDMARLESGFLKPKMDWCDISDLISTTIRKLEVELKDRTLRISVEDNMPLVRLDTGLTEQVLTNLLYNACLYTPPEATVEVEAWIENRNCIITVADTGPGIPAEMSDKIFQKFFRVSNGQTGGTGLGLSIARGFIEAQGGTIAFQNRDKGGSAFRISLPVEENITVKEV